MYDCQALPYLILSYRDGMLPPKAEASSGPIVRPHDCQAFTIIKTCKSYASNICHWHITPSKHVISRRWAINSCHSFRIGDFPWQISATTVDKPVKTMFLTSNVNKYTVTDNGT